MENTFKLRKEIKYDTVLYKAKRAQKEKAHYQAKSGPNHVEKESPNLNQMISNWRKTSWAWPIHSQRPTTRRQWREGLVRGHSTPHGRLSIASSNGSHMAPCRGGGDQALHQILVHTLPYSTYKRRPLPPHSTHHKEKSFSTFEQHSKGLRP